MEGTTEIIIVLGLASITFLGLSVWLAMVIEDLRLENKKLMIELKHAKKPLTNR